MNVVKVFIQWICFTLLFLSAALCLERIEGFKITTTEYYGLQNFGLGFVFIMFFLAVAFYPIILLPLSILIRKVVKMSVIPFLIYSLLGVIGGMVVFDFLYDDYFVLLYKLNKTSAILIFGFVGFLFALLENLLNRRRG